MKYLLFSDIHGCLPALQRALDFFEAQKCDMMCILGDIINYGPRNRISEGIDPKGIVERLNNLADKIIAVRGNCDAEVDQMLLDFPIMETYALLVDGGKRYLLTHGHIYNKENIHQQGEPFAGRISPPGGIVERDSSETQRALPQCRG